MGKRERIKRSPTHSQAKIKLSLKELQDFVVATNVETDTEDIDENNLEIVLDESRSIEDLSHAFGSIHDSCEIAKGRFMRQGFSDALTTTTNKEAKEIPNVVAAQDLTSAVNEGPSKFESFLLEVMKDESPCVSMLPAAGKGGNLANLASAQDSSEVYDVRRVRYFNQDVTSEVTQMEVLSRLDSDVHTQDLDFSGPQVKGEEVGSLTLEDPADSGFNTKNAELRSKLEAIKSRLSSLSEHKPATGIALNKDGDNVGHVHKEGVRNGCFSSALNLHNPIPPIETKAATDHMHFMSAATQSSHTTANISCDGDKFDGSAIGNPSQNHPNPRKVCHGGLHAHLRTSGSSLDGTHKAAAVPARAAGPRRPTTQGQSNTDSQDTTFGPPLFGATHFQACNEILNGWTGDDVSPKAKVAASLVACELCPTQDSAHVHTMGPVTSDMFLSHCPKESATCFVRRHAMGPMAADNESMVPGRDSIVLINKDEGGRCEPGIGSPAHGTLGITLAGSGYHVHQSQSLGPLSKNSESSSHDKSYAGDHMADNVGGSLPSHPSQDHRSGFNICNKVGLGSVTHSYTQTLSPVVNNNHHVANSDPKDLGQGLNIFESSIKKPFVELFKPAHEQTHSYIANLESGDTQRVGSADHGSDDISQVPLNDSPFNLVFVDHGGRKDSLVLPIPRDLTDAGKEEWSTTLVGRFLGKKLPYSLVTNATDRFWAKEGLVDTLATDSGCFFFSFANEGFRDAVLEGGPWFIAGQPILLRPWKPNFSFDKEEVQSVPIWVNFYGIPLEYWNPEGISFISSFIGKPIRVDRMTASRRRITFARVCIEVSAENDFIDEFNIEAYDEESGKPILTKIKLEYQWTPVRCKNCSIFGHDCARVENPLPLQNAQNRYKTKKEVGVWQTVTRKAKVKQSIEDHIPTPNRRSKEDTNLYGSQALSPSGSVVDRIIIGPSLIPFKDNAPKDIKGSAMNVGNMFSALSHATCEDAQRSNLKEDVCSLRAHEREEVDDNVEVDNELIDEECVFDFHDSIPSPVVSMSSRQKKKEAKMQFGGSRPKGRHRP